MSIFTKQLALCLLLSAVTLAGCDASMAEREAASRTEVLSFSSIADFERAIKSAEKRSADEQAEWESSRGFTSLRTVHARDQHARAEAVVGAGEADIDEGIASLLNPEGNVIVEGYTLHVDGLRAHLYDPAGSLVRSTTIERGVATSSAVASSNPPPFAQTYFGGIPTFASDRRATHQWWRMNSKIYLRDYIVYGVFGAYTESERLERNSLRGFYYSNANAETIAIDCSLVTGRSHAEQERNASKVNLNFDRIFVSPGYVSMAGTTAGTLISGGLVLSNVYVGCEHAVTAYSSWVMPGASRTAQAVTSY